MFKSPDVEVMLAFRLMLLPAFKVSVVVGPVDLLTADETVMSLVAASVTSVLSSSVPTWMAVIRLVAPG